MEVNDGERVVIAKPVASRPSSSSGFRTFTELLTDSVTVSPQTTCHEIVDAAIRPKTLRFNQPVAASVSCPRVSSCLFNSSHCYLLSASSSLDSTISDNDRLK
jgi:hypothetical protein